MSAAVSAPSRRAALLAAAGVFLLACLPSVGTLRAPWIAEDAAILARVGRDGPWADWTRPQYGLEVLRFWRPLVSTSWAVQEAWTGIAPGPLRLFNVLVHALCAVLVLGCVLRLGAGLGAALLGGAWVASFPEQGGTSTWLAGRTDLLCAAFLLASAFAALGRRPLASAPLAFLACAAKEFGFLAPLWIALFARAGGASFRASARRATPALAATAVAFVWRALALRGITGAYPVVLPDPWSGLVGTARAVAGGAGTSWAAFAVLVIAGSYARSCSRRVGWAAVAAVLALVPLYPLLADGFLEPENRRLFYAAECALALAAGLTCATKARSVIAGRAVAVVALAVIGSRCARAWTDTHDWARSAAAGEEAVARARAAVAGASRDERPVLFADFPVSLFGAYCLGFGVADRFRAPFPETPRPIWPWREAFAAGGPESSAYVVPLMLRRDQPLVPVRADGSIWPLDDAPPLEALGVRGEDGRALDVLVLDERALLSTADRSPRIGVGNASGFPFAGAPLALRVFSEAGYASFPLSPLDEFGEASFTTMQLLVCSNGVTTVAELLQHVADLGGARVYLELRAGDPKGMPIAASRWIELTWAPELARAALRAR